jgi:hypothetical protein
MGKTGSKYKNSSGKLKGRGHLVGGSKLEYNIKMFLEIIT